MNRLLAVMSNTVAQAIRNRVAFVIMGVYLVLVPVLPFIVEGDGTLTGLLHVVIAYLLIASGLLLKVLTIALSTTTLWSEIRDRQIYLLQSTPVRRWEILLGKLLGIVAIDAGMLAVMAIATLLCVRVIFWQGQWDAGDRELARRQVLTARSVLGPRPAVSEQELQRHYDTLKERGRLPADRTEADVKGQLRRRLTAVANVVPPRAQRLWRFDNVAVPAGAPCLDKGRVARAGPNAIEDDRKAWQQDQWRLMTVSITGGTGRGQARSIAHNTDRRLWINGSWSTMPDSTSRYVIQPAPTLRFKFYRSDGAQGEPMRCLWGLGEPQSPGFQRVAPSGYKAGEFAELAVPIDAIGEEGTVPVRLYNADAGEVAAVFSGEDAIQLLVPRAGFASNLCRGLVLQFVELLFLAALGLFFSTFVEFPTAPIAAFSVLLLIVMAGAVRADVETGAAFDKGQASSAAYRAYEVAARGVVAAMGYVLPRLERTSSASPVSSGVVVPWGLVAAAWGELVVLRSGILMLAGAWLFHVREVGLYGR